jgi:hypothetical protein
LHRRSVCPAKTRERPVRRQAGGDRRRTPLPDGVEAIDGERMRDARQELTAARSLRTRAALWPFRASLIGLRAPLERVTDPRRQPGRRRADRLEQRRRAIRVVGKVCAAGSRGGSRVRRSGRRAPAQRAGRLARVPGGLADSEFPCHMGDRTRRLDHKPGHLIPELRRIGLVFPWQLTLSFPAGILKEGRWVADRTR